MPKKIDMRYRESAIKFLFLYNKLKTKLSVNDLAYLFKNYYDYDIDYIYFEKPKYRKWAIDMMKHFNILVEYLDDESLNNLTQLGGQL